MILPSDGDPPCSIPEAMQGGSLPEWTQATALCGLTVEAQRRRAWMYAKPVRDGCARRLVASGTVRRIDIASNAPEHAFSHRSFPGRDPAHPGDTPDVFLLPCDWCAASNYCDGFNVAYLGMPAGDIKHIVTFFGGCLKGAQDVRAFAEEVLSVPHRSDTIILIEPDLMALLSDIPAVGIRR